MEKQIKPDRFDLCFLMQNYIQKMIEEVEGVKTLVLDRETTSKGLFWVVYGRNYLVDFLEFSDPE